MGTVVKSLRIDPNLWAEVEAFATDHGMSANAAVAALFRRGLDGPTPAPEPVPAAPKPSPRPPPAAAGRTIPGKGGARTAVVATRGAPIGYHPVTGELLYRSAPKTPAPA